MGIKRKQGINKQGNKVLNKVLNIGSYFSNINQYYYTT